MRGYAYLPLLIGMSIVASGCAGGRGAGDGAQGSTCDPAEPTCADGLVCNAVITGVSICATPLRLRGVVLDATTDEPIGGALVQAVDVNGAAVGTSTATAEDGTYELTVPAIRDETGAPVEGSVTLRSQAHTYQPFPTAIRPALPIDAATAAMSEDQSGFVLENPLTTIKLLPLPGDTSTLGSISGSIDAEFNAGILVVAEGANGGVTGFSDADGVYTIFNVSAGSYSVRGYAAGVQLNETTASLTAGEQLTGVDLTSSANPLSAVSGNVQIVNAPGGSLTSVILAVESTFVEDAARGEAPPGLRVGEVSGTFTINDVPDGEYVVLAAFENDGLVRDPDQTIGGTQIVRIVVPDPVDGNNITLSDGFKVTGALAVVAPGADGPDVVTSASPTFEWDDDSSEDGYALRVFDAFGNEIWSDELGPTSGSATVTHTYAGPTLESGMFYQFRATSFRDKNGVRTAISTTEDLKGVFQYVTTP